MKFGLFSVRRVLQYGGIRMSSKNMTSENEDQRQVVNHIAIHGSSVVVGSSDTEIHNGDGASSSGEMEDDLVRVFRGFTMREKTRFLQGAYDFEDQCAEDRQKEAQK